jgi:hypothetical protein
VLHLMDAWHERRRKAGQETHPTPAMPHSAPDFTSDNES